MNLQQALLNFACRGVDKALLLISPAGEVQIVPEARFGPGYLLRGDFKKKSEVEAFLRQHVALLVFKVTSWYTAYKPEDLNPPQEILGWVRETKKKTRSGYINLYAYYADFEIFTASTAVEYFKENGRKGPYAIVRAEPAPEGGKMRVHQFRIQALGPNHPGLIAAAKARAQPLAEKRGWLLDHTEERKASSLHIYVIADLKLPPLPQPAASSTSPEDTDIDPEEVAKLAAEWGVSPPPQPPQPQPMAEVEEERPLTVEEKIAILKGQHKRQQSQDAAASETTTQPQTQAPPLDLDRAALAAGFVRRRLVVFRLPTEYRGSQRKISRDKDGRINETIVLSRNPTAFRNARAKFYRILRRIASKTTMGWVLLPDPPHEEFQKLNKVINILNSLAGASEAVQIIEVLVPREYLTQQIADWITELRADLDRLREKLQEVEEKSRLYYQIRSELNAVSHAFMAWEKELEEIEGQQEQG